MPAVSSVSLRVRDLAEMHVRAMIPLEAAGQRSVAIFTNTAPVWLADLG